MRRLLLSVEVKGSVLRALNGPKRARGGIDMASFDEMVKKHLSKVEINPKKGKKLTFDEMVKKHLSKVEIVKRKEKRR